MCKRPCSMICARKRAHRLQGCNPYGMSSVLMLEVVANYKLRRTMAQSETNYQFHLARQAYKRISWQAWLFFGVFLLCVLLGIIGGIALWPTYTHQFTLYLKW